MRTTKSIAELRSKKSCGIAIADLQNLTSAIPQLSTVSNIIFKKNSSLLPIPLRSSPFSSAQDGFKNKPKLFSELFVPLETKLTLKGQLHEIFYLRFFCSNSMAKNMPKIAEVKLSSCGFKVADLKKNCDCGVAVAEQHFFKSCGIAIAEVLPSSCGIAVADSKKSSNIEMTFFSPTYLSQISE